MLIREVLATAMAFLLAGSAAAAQTTKRVAPTEYTGVTTNLTPGSGSPLSVRILNWSSDEDRRTVLGVVADASSDKAAAVPDLTKQLAATSSVGQIWTNGAIGYSLKYAHRSALPGGGERIVVITDRPLGVVEGRGPWKATSGQDAKVHPFTIVELHVNKAGRGDGKMSLDAPFTINPTDQTVALTDYASAPVMVTKVELKPKPYWAEP